MVDLPVCQFRGEKIGDDLYWCACDRMNNTPGVIRGYGQCIRVVAGEYKNCAYSDVGSAPAETLSQLTLKDGPGTELKHILKDASDLIHSLSKIIPIESVKEVVLSLAQMLLDDPNCECNKHARIMDEWGTEKCYKEIKTIIGWLRIEAERRGLYFSTFISRQIVLYAIRRAEKKELDFSGDVALLTPMNQSWAGPARAHFFSQVLRDAGYKPVVVPTRSENLELNLGRFHLVINHAMVLNPGIIRKAAIEYSDTTFINMNHSALAHLEYLSSKHFSNHIECLKLARELPNCWYASQGSIAECIRESTGIDRCIWLPTPCHEIEPRKYRAPNEPAVVVLAGRQDAIKNNMTQLVACGLLKEEIKLVICMDHKESMQDFIDQMGIEHEWKGRLPHGEWLEFLQQEADIVLCCSLAESFGYVAIEAMQSGVPVVASDAIHFADPDLIVRGNCPDDIAYAVKVALKEYERFAERSAKIGREVAEKQNRVYLERLSEFMGQSLTTVP